MAKADTATSATIRGVRDVVDIEVAPVNTPGPTRRAG
jgi:hypothetical protein